MDQLFAAFGIDWRLLLINAINFGVLLGGLSFFLYKPITKALEDRRLKVIKGVEDAEAAAAALAEIEGTRAATLAQAGQEADDLISKAQKTGTQKGKEILAQAESAASRAIADADAQALELKKKAIQESKEEVAKMIVLGIEKLAKTSK
jgi:F-type H+-transporting ATPase subunit b